MDDGDIRKGRVRLGHVIPFLRARVYVSRLSVLAALLSCAWSRCARVYSLSLVSVTTSLRVRLRAEPFASVPWILLKRWLAQRDVSADSDLRLLLASVAGVTAGSCLWSRLLLMLAAVATLRA